MVSYRVKVGDYLYKLARKYNFTIDEFLKNNASFDQRNINLIYPGEVIKYYDNVCEVNDLT
nr:LysM domain-containing protein [Aliivibrio fischeri]